MDALVYSSVVLFLSALIVFLINIKHYRRHLDALVFLLIGLPLTVVAIRGTIESIHYNRTPDLVVKYKLPVTRERYLYDSTMIKTAIDSLVAIHNQKYGGPDVLSTLIDTIIYSQKGDKIFISYIKKYERNNLGNDLYPDYLAANKRDGVFWQLTTTRYRMSGSYHDVVSLKKAVRKFYFNQFSFMDKDSTAKNYLWKVVL
jgi:hypothetical protein